MAKKNDARPQHGMLIGLAIGSILMAILLLLLYDHVHKPAVQTKPNQAPLATQN
jgi:hypothetical protein